MLPREVRLFADMGDIAGHVVRAQRAHIRAGDVTIECLHGPMETEWLEGHLLLPQWRAVDDRGKVYRATSRGSGRSQDGSRTSVEITFRGVDPEAEWLDVGVHGYDGRPVLAIRVPFTGGGGEATVPAVPLPPNPPSSSALRVRSPSEQGGATVGMFNQPPGSWTGSAAPSAGRPRGEAADAARHRREAEQAAAEQRRRVLRQLWLKLRGRSG